MPLVNERIRAHRVQLITQDGVNIGTVPRERALQMAQEAGMDLVLIVEQGNEGIPVVKIMDFGKAAYAKKKKQAEAKKHQKVIQVKEIKMAPKIGEHDFQTKINQAIQFLEEGKRVRITLVFRGREIGMKDEKGTSFFDRIDAAFEQHDLLKNLVIEQDAKGAPAQPTMGRMVLWTKLYYLKNK